MSLKPRSTDPGLSPVERKALRSHEAEEAMADHEQAEQVSRDNLGRLRAERREREAVAGPMLYPAPELPDDALVEKIHFSTRIRNALTAGGFKTAGEIREASDATRAGLANLNRSISGISA